MKEFAPYYFFIYWFVVMLITISKYNNMRSLKGYTVISQRDNYTPLIMFSLFYILFFGLRPVSILFGDTVIYEKLYNVMQSYGVYRLDLLEDGSIEVSDNASSDWLFYSVMFLCAQVMSVNSFFVIVMFFYITMMYQGCRKLDFKHGATLMLFCIGAFSFYGYSVNGIRNGVACSFVILALAQFCRGEKLWPAILAFIALGCHKSVALPIVCALFSYYIKKPKYMYIIWVGSIFISLAIGGYLSNMLTLLGFDERLAQNLQSGADVEQAWGVEMENRFRWDFLLYSSMPIVLGWYAIFKRKVYNITYLMLLGTYMYANAFWVVLIRSLFSNRFAYLSWFLYPIVLSYPLMTLPVFKKQHSKKTAWILLAHFGFTTVMWLLGKLG